MADEVSFEYLKSLENNKNAFIIDVREPSELAVTGEIPGSINIPLNTLEDVLKNLNDTEFRSKFGRGKPDLDTEIVFSCRSGRRSKAALDAVQALGFLNAKHFPGGWLQWEEKTGTN